MANPIVNWFAEVIHNNRTLKLYGSKHKELAKIHENVRDSPSWDKYYNVEFDKFLPKAKSFTFHGQKYKSKDVYVQSIENGDVNLPAGKVIKASTKNIIAKPKKGFVKGNVLYESKEQADEIERVKLENEANSFLGSVVVPESNVIEHVEAQTEQNGALKRKKFEVNIRNMDTVKDFISSTIVSEIGSIFRSRGAFILKVNYKLATMKPNKQKDDREVYETWTEKMYILSNADVSILKTDLANQFANSVETLPTRGSGIVFRALKEVIIYASAYTPPAGSSYVPLPDWLNAKKCCVNVQNNDNKCFAWAVLSALHPAETNAQRTSKYADKWDSINLEGIEFPVKLESIKKFEMQNQVSINVFSVEGRNAVLVYFSKKPRNTDQIVNLLLHNNHYCCIKNFDRFMNKNGDHQMFYCESCGVGFSSAEILKNHLANGGCSPQFVSLPKDDAKVAFTNIRNSLACPLVIYADFESMLKPSNKSSKKTEVVQEHIANAFACMSVARDDPSFNEFHMDVVQDAGMDFIQYLRDNAGKYYDFIHQNKKVEMTSAESKAYQSATHCHICKKELNGDKVWDHNHITGKYRGPAHNDCNLQYRQADYVPVLFHNLTGYDGQFIIDALTRIDDFRPQISAIAISGEKFKAITVSVYAGWKMNESKGKEEAVYMKYRFIDSAGFLNSALSTLADNLPDEKKHFTKGMFSDAVKFGVMKKKGFFPYDVVKSMDDLQMKALPAFESLNPIIGKIDKEDYEAGQEAWKVFDCKTLKDYLKVYLMADVVLLADIFEEFRAMCLNYYGLDPVHYVSLPSMAWDALLKMSNIKLDLISDYDLFLMVEKAKRGGVSFIGHRYAKANNQYMKDYDKTKESNYLMYLDANNLYGWSMSQPLPTGDYKFVSKSVDQLLSWKETEDVGYFVECDLEYPKVLHKMHAMLPLAPVSKTVQQSELSEFQSSFEVKGSTSKLMTTLEDKNKYVLHIKNLQQYLSLGMKCKAVHRVVQFAQSPWMKPYIDFNTDKRSKAKSDFEKDLFKLMNNAVFGKTLENVRDRMKVEFVNRDDDEKLRKITAKPTYTGGFQELNNLYAIKMNQRRIVLDKPIAVGVAILDLSKWLMFDFHYNTMIPRYGYENMKLLLTDTDSLFYQIKTKDVYADIREMRSLFDMAGYAKTHPNYDPTNNKVIGKFKDEESQDIITEFVGLRSKLYAYRTEKGTTEKRCKGIKKYVVEDFTFEMYKNTLDTLNDYEATMAGIRSKDHKLQTYKITKKALSAYDDKRYYLDNINSIPYGYKA